MDFVTLTVYTLLLLNIPTTIITGIYCFKKIDVVISSFSLLCVSCVINSAAVIVHIVSLINFNHLFCHHEIIEAPHTITSTTEQIDSLL